MKRINSLIICFVIGIVSLIAQDYSSYLQNANQWVKEGNTAISQGNIIQAQECANKAKKLYDIYTQLSGTRNSSYETSYDKLNSDIAQASRPPVMEINVNGITFEMNLINGGKFRGRVPELGVDCQRSTAKDWTLSDLETEDFYMATTEVTQDLWEAVMGETFEEFIDNKIAIHSDNPDFSSITDHKAYGIGARYPVYYIEESDIAPFIDMLNRITGKKFRLPTSTEWIYAESGGEKSNYTTYAGSDNINEVAWYQGNSGNSTHPVGTKKANELGLYDMTGNVMERTASASHAYGNSWKTFKRQCQKQNAWKHDGCSYLIGFRLAMD